MGNSMDWIKVQNSEYVIKYLQQYESSWGLLKIKTAGLIAQLDAEYLFLTELSVTGVNFKVKEQEAQTERKWSEED